MILLNNVVKILHLANFNGRIVIIIELLDVTIVQTVPQIPINSLQNNALRKMFTWKSFFNTDHDLSPPKIKSR